MTSRANNQGFDVVVAKAEARVKPDAVADELGREAMSFVEIGWDWRIHTASMPHETGVRKEGSSHENCPGFLSDGVPTWSAWAINFTMPCVALPTMKLWMK